MNFSNVSFYKSVSLGMNEVYFEEKKEIIFVGRSNVGKSSLMNAIFQKKDFVKTSSKPGKTKLANIFLVANKYYFTDLPWYGFAKVSKQMQKDLDGLISWYVEEKRENIKKVVLLIDGKIGMQKKDRDMYEFLLGFWLEVVIIISKVDKLSQKDISSCIGEIKEHFFGQEVIPVSATTKQGLRELEKILVSSLIF